MVSSPSNGKGKRAPQQGVRVLKVAQSRPVASSVVVVLLLFGVVTLCLHSRAGEQGPGTRTNKGNATLSSAGQGESGRRAQLLQQSALMEDADRLEKEVLELARELEELRSGAPVGEAGLTLRERLWQEKERAGDMQEGEAAAEAGGAEGGSGSDGGTSGGGSSDESGIGGAAIGSNGAGGRAVPEKLQTLLLAREQRAGQAQRNPGLGLHQQLGLESLLRPHGLGAAAAGGLSASALPPVPPRPDPVVEKLSDAEVERRRGEIVKAMKHAWGGYVQHAWGHDELAPVSEKGKDGFGGLGATIIDSLDTLLMMGMREEYDRAVEWISTEMQLDASFDASVFETIIRVVGGFLAAHEVTGDEVLLRKSEELAQRLMPAYNTSTGIPFNTINLQTLKVKNPNWNLKASTLAEFGTHQLEFFKLSQKTGNAMYTQKAEATIRYLYDRNPGQGLMPLFVNPTTGKFTNRKVSFGALGDSYYEYLIKMWVLRGRPKDDMYREMWEQAMDEMIDRLVFTSKEGFVYIAEFDRFQVKHKMDHLVCFVPGMLALGVYSGAVKGEKADRYLQVAAGVTHTCWKMYHTQPTGLSPEYIMFGPTGLRVGAAYNMLRPEALEAFWYMWRMTRDWKYRAWAWEVFQAFEVHCKTNAGYSGVKDVRRLNVTHDDTQQSFFLAETLKYLYLIFSPDDALDWDVWVLNTEAHPLRIVGGKAGGGQQHKAGRKSRFGFGSLWRRSR